VAAPGATFGPPEICWNASPIGYEIRRKSFIFVAENPQVPHPRWSQASEEVIGTGERRPTLLFNGYGEYVAGLYKDLEGERPWA
jgi:hypothetical protein